jgi:uncharacterized protein with GYD domain
MTTETSNVQKPTTAFFLLQGTYSSYTWIYRTTTDPDDFRRPPDMKGLLEEFGAKLHGIWYSFGEYDLVSILELEKAEDMAGIMIGLKAGWEGKAFDKLKATPLLNQDEAAKACGKASEGLKNSRDASKDGPLKGTMDYTNVEFNKKPVK